MRLLLDANISLRILAPLQALGHDVISMLHEHPNASDVVVLQKAYQEERTVITYDKDFGELVFQEEYAHVGIILLRVHHESHQAQLKALKKFLIHHAEREIQEHFWVITESLVRKARV